MKGASVRNLRTIGLAAMIAVTALVASACGGGGTPSASTTTPTTVAARPSSTAKLTILSPKTGSVVHGTSVDLRFALEGARIVKQTSTTLRPDEGHVHVLLDGQLISMNYGLTDSIPNLTPGQHLLQVEVVATDHAPFDPRVIAVTSFEVQA
jgi:hypothetical protein